MQQESSVGRKILVKQKYLKFIQTEKWCWSFNNSDGTEAAVLLLPWKQHWSHYFVITLSTRWQSILRSPETQKYICTSKRSKIKLFRLLWSKEELVESATIKCIWK